SLTSMPLRPYFLNEKGEPISAPAFLRPVLTESGGRSPWCFERAGLGSNVSTCDGPPFMNRKMTLLALGAKWGGFGASGLVAERSARADSPARAPARPSVPKPPPIRRSHSRRVQPADEIGCRMAVTLDSVRFNPRRRIR